jgi:hypothetical protein
MPTNPDEGVYTGLESDPPETTPASQVREVIADAYSFIRSVQANAAFATVTLEQLISDQITRNGETSRSNGRQYDPYSYNPQHPPPAGLDVSRVNFLGGADTTQATKLDRVLAIRNRLASVIAQIRAASPTSVASTRQYTDRVPISVPPEVS